MIRVIITGKDDAGSFPYSVSVGNLHFAGKSRTPLLEACRRLKSYGTPDSDSVGMFSEGSEEPRLVTTVGYGAGVEIDTRTGEFRRRARPARSSG